LLTLRIVDRDDNIRRHHLDNMARPLTCQVVFTICRLKLHAYGACNVALPHCRHHSGVQWWWGVVERQLPEVVVGGDGGDTAVVVAMTVVVEKEKLCLFVDNTFVMGQTSRDLPTSNSEGIPLPSLKGRGLCGVGHSIP